MTDITHAQAFRAQQDFAPEAKLVVHGENIWKFGTAGHRFFTEVLAKKPSTVQAAIDKAANLKEPFTAIQAMGHMRWYYTMNGGPLEVDGQRYAGGKTKKVEPKAEPKKVEAKAKVMAAKQQVQRRTQAVKHRAA